MTPGQVVETSVTSNSSFLLFRTTLTRTITQFLLMLDKLKVLMFLGCFIHDVPVVMATKRVIFGKHKQFISLI